MHLIRKVGGVNNPYRSSGRRVLESQESSISVLCHHLSSLSTSLINGSHSAKFSYSYPVTLTVDNPILHANLHPYNNIHTTMPQKGDQQLQVCATSPSKMARMATIAVLRKQILCDSLILTKHYRSHLNAYTIEFPAQVSSQLVSTL